MKQGGWGELSCVQVLDQDPLDKNCLPDLSVKRNQNPVGSSGVFSIDRTLLCCSSCRPSDHSAGSGGNRFSIIVTCGSVRK